MGTLYIATSPSGKKYVGITIQPLASRIVAHRAAAKFGKKNVFCDALRKYSDEITWNVLADGVLDHELLNLAEQEAISKYGTKHPFGYNMTDGGGGTLGMSEESRKRISAERKGKPRSRDSVEKMRATMTGRTVSEKEASRLKTLRCGVKHSPETIEKIRAARIGKKRGPVSSDTAEKISAGNKAAYRKRLEAGNPFRKSDETRAKLSATKTGMRLSEEVKELRRQKMQQRIFQETKNL